MTGKYAFASQTVMRFSNSIQLPGSSCKLLVATQAYLHKTTSSLAPCCIKTGKTLQREFARSSSNPSRRGAACWWRTWASRWTQYCSGWAQRFLLLDPKVSLFGFAKPNHCQTFAFGVSRFCLFGVTFFLFKPAKRSTFSSTGQSSLATP